MSFPVTWRGEALSVSREVDLIGREGRWHIPEEVPVAFVYNRRNYAVMMASPSNLVDFATGFSLTERVVKGVRDIHSLEVRQTPQGVDYRITIKDDCIDRLDVVQRRRNLIGSASCGLCGLENADALFAKLPEVADAPVALAPDAMVRAMGALRGHQTVNKTTRSVHAAAFATAEGSIVAAREDVGRHNALDKLLGALALDGIDPSDGFVLMSSRCSYEIVEKAARMGVRSLVSISGPTAFAIRKAEQAKLSLYSRVIEKGHLGSVRLV